MSTKAKAASTAQQLSILASFQKQRDLVVKDAQDAAIAAVQSGTITLTRSTTTTTNIELTSSVPALMSSSINNNLPTSTSSIDDDDDDDERAMASHFPSTSANNNGKYYFIMSVYMSNDLFEFMIYIFFLIKEIIKINKIVRKQQPLFKKMICSKRKHKVL